jgi:hypothetical protein
MDYQAIRSSAFGLSGFTVHMDPVAVKAVNVKDETPTRSRSWITNPDLSAHDPTPL